MKQLIVIIFISFLFINNSGAQENCKVLTEALKGTYTGECEKGKANGKGKAVGIDEYEGDFKKGYPDGQGMYIWKDGHYYMGTFVKGQMEGNGKMFYESHIGDDSTITGFWKKGEYTGEYEKAFELKSSTTQISRINCQIAKKGDAGGIVITTSGVSMMPVITEISVISGQFINRLNNKVGFANLTRLQQMTFPFRARFYYSNGENFEMIFYEDTMYEISVHMM